MLKKYKNKYRIKSARRPTWDYGSDGAYFITICTKNRNHFFGEIIVGLKEQEMQLSEIGKIADEYWKEIPKHFPFIILGKHIIMPDHMHGILTMNKEDFYAINKNNDRINDVIPIETVLKNVELYVNGASNDGLLTGDESYTDGDASNDGLLTGDESYTDGDASNDGLLTGDESYTDGDASNDGLLTGDESYTDGDASNDGLLTGDESYTDGDASNVETLQCNVSTLDADWNISDITKGLHPKKTVVPVNEKMQSISPKPGTISTIIRSYKSAVSNSAHKINPRFNWQPRFHDHIVRDFLSLARIENYISNNPKNWNKKKKRKK